MMDNYDFYTKLLEEGKKGIEQKIVECRDTAQKREQWMKQNLAQFIQDKLTSKNWYSKIKEISLLWEYYEGVNGSKKEDLRDGYKGFIAKIYPFMIGNKNLNDWPLFKQIEEPEVDLHNLPRYSTLTKIKFKLKKPYISGDDEEFYIMDNPVSKEKVFKIPYIRPSSWKGALRHVVRGRLEISKSIVERLFGNEKENEELNVRGRLQFYPTFFNKIGLDVINPHDRKTKTGKNPILYEVVPDEASGTFSLLYVPFDLIGNEKELKNQVREDLEIISNAVEKLLTFYGFSAKKTSGYGIAKLENKFFDINCPESEKKEFEKIISDAIKI